MPGAFARAGPRNVRRRVGGRRFRRRTFRRKFMRTRMRRRGGRKAFAKAVKRVLFATCEKKYKSMLLPNSTLAHNGGTGSTVSQWTIYDENTTGLMPIQGSGDGERNGDEIYTTGIRVRFEMSAPYDRCGVEYKMWLTEYNTAQGDPAAKADFWHNVSGNYLLDPVQTDRWKTKVISKGIIQKKGVDYIDATAGYIESDNKNARTIIRSLWIPFRRKITFKNDGSSVVAKGMKEALKVTMVAYHNYDTLTTDILSKINRATATLYYKDP